MPKLLAYAMQFVLLTGSVLVLLLVGGPKRRRGTAASVLAYLSVLAMLLSCAASSFIGTHDGSLVYTAVMVYYVGLFWVFTAFRFERIHLWINSRILMRGAGLLMVIGLAQQYFHAFRYLPGNDIYSVAGHLRPSSTTGSYLHYPLALAILLFPLVQQRGRTRSRSSLFAYIAGLALVLSLSRSGLLTLAAGIVAYLLIRRAWAAAVALTTLLSIVILLPLPYMNNVYIVRAVNAGSLSASGNTGRVDIWQQALHMWLDTNLLLGEYAGSVTNAVANLGDSSGIIVESGLLQQMLNFGLIGAIAFYAVILGGLQGIHKEHAWLRAGLIAACLESFFYQSIEVLPFMALLSLYPAISDSFASGGESSTQPIARMVRPDFGVGTVARTTRGDS